MRSVIPKAHFLPCLKVSFIILPGAYTKIPKISLKVPIEEHLLKTTIQIPLPSGTLPLSFFVSRFFDQNCDLIF